MFKRAVHSIKELRAQAEAPRVGWVYRLVNYLAYYPAKLFLYTSLTPNQITILWAIIQVISTFFLIKGDYLTTIIALLVFHSMFILDCTDGIVARYRKQFSLNGIYLDNIGHYVANSCLLIFFTIGTFRQHPKMIYILFGFLALMFYLLNKALTLNPVLYKEEDRIRVLEASGKSYIQKQNRFFVSVFNFMRLEHFFNLLFWGAVLGYPHIVLIIYSGVYFLELLRKLGMQFMLLRRTDASRKNLGGR